MTVSVIISTYNSPEWLEKVLWGYENQTYANFELVIADDGSERQTRNLIESFRRHFKLSISHVWHPDDGFQKSRILNKAINAATGTYLIFSDGDCIPRKDFVKVHVKHARKGSFLSGGYFKLPMSISKLISKEDIIQGYPFEAQWLLEHGQKRSYKLLKLIHAPFLQRMLNGLTPCRATWNGHNSSGWKADILAVNGFNEEMQYGGQDRELGERLVNIGIKPRQIRYSAICVHLDHARGYMTEESIRKNRNIRKHTRLTKRTWTEEGILKGDRFSFSETWF